MYMMRFGTILLIAELFGLLLVPGAVVAVTVGTVGTVNQGQDSFGVPVSSGSIFTLGNDEESGETIAIEFKYHREIPSKTNAPRPMKAGKLFHDLKRLMMIKNSAPTRTLLVFLTDKEMATYFSNQKNGLTDFFFLDPGQTLKIQTPYFYSKSTTFTNAAGGAFNVNISCLYSESLPAEHELRIYETIS